MRILHTIHSVNPAEGGPIENVRQLAGVNVGNGHSVEIASLDAPGDACVKDCPLPVIPLGPSMFNYRYSGRFVPWLRANASRYDVVVVNGIWQYQCYGTWRALHNKSTPYVVYTHGMLDPWFKRTYPLKHIKKWLYWFWGNYPALRDASAVVFTGEEERVLARQSFWLYKAREAVVGSGTAGPGGDGAAQRVAFLERYPELRNKRLALFMGRIQEKKGCDLLIRAFAQTLAADPNWHLVMAGPDQVGWKRELDLLARNLGLGQRITWTGMTSGDVKWGLIRCSEIFVLPSHQENFGIAVAEALACGVPVLISDKVNIWREVLQGGAGLVDADDLAGTRRMLARWAEMPEEARSQMVANARPSFEKWFEIRATANNVMTMLARVLEGRPVPHTGEDYSACETVADRGL